MKIIESYKAQRYNNDPQRVVKEGFRDDDSLCNYLRDKFEGSTVKLSKNLISIISDTYDIDISNPVKLEVDEEVPGVITFTPEPISEYYRHPRQSGDADGDIISILYEEGRDENPEYPVEVLFGDPDSGERVSADSPEEIISIVKQYLSSVIDSINIWSDDFDFESKSRKRSPQLIEAIQKVAKSSGYSYSPTDFKKQIKLINSLSNDPKSQKKELKELLSSSRDVSHQVEDLIDRLTKYNDALKTYNKSSHTPNDATKLGDSISNLSI